MGGGFYELGDKICLMRFRPELMPDNTELWELDNTDRRKKTDQDNGIIPMQLMRQRSRNPEK